MWDNSINVKFNFQIKKQIDYILKYLGLAKTQTLNTLEVWLNFCINIIKLAEPLLYTYMFNYSDY